MRSENLMPGLQWTSEQQRKNEWQFASLWLNNKPTGTKLKRSLAGDNQAYRVPGTNNMLILEHSYIVVENKLLALNGKGLYIGYGTFGKVKLAEDKDGKKYAVKISTKKTPFLQLEAEISKDLQFGLESFHRKTAKGDKYYLATNYLGESLYKFLGKQGSTLTRDQRYDLAIKVGLAVNALHQGEHSISLNKYAHLDLKPENITIDDQGEVHLIDYGFAESLEGNAEKFCGTPIYLAQDSPHKEKASLDIYALLRTLFLPKNFQALKGPMHRTKGDPIIFSDAVIEGEPQLKRFLHTQHGEISQRVANYQAIDIVANLILLKNNLMTVANKQRMRDSHLRSDIIEAHLKGLPITQDNLDVVSVDDDHSAPRDSESEVIVPNYRDRFDQVYSKLDKLETYRKAVLVEDGCVEKNIAAADFIREISNKLTQCIKVGSILEFGSLFNRQSDNFELFSSRRSTKLPILFSILGSLSVVGLIVGLCQYFGFSNRNQFLFFKVKPDTARLADEVKTAVHEVAPCA